MQEKEKMYTLALMILVLTGISAAWAAYSNFATLAISNDVSELASVSGYDYTFKKQIYKEGWFYFTKTGAFRISNPQTNKIFVRVTLVNPAELKEYYDPLSITVKLYEVNGDDNEYVEEVITLKNPEVILDPTASSNDLDADGSIDWKIDVTVNGFAIKAGDSPDIVLHCSVEPAEVAK